MTFYITFNHWGCTVKYKLALYVKHEYYMNQNIMTYKAFYGKRKRNCAACPKKCSKESLLPSLAVSLLASNI